MALAASTSGAAKAWFAVLLIVVQPVALEAQGWLLAPQRTFGVEQPLFDVRAAGTDGDTVVVLTGSAPFIHILEGSSTESWGREGDGPGELRNPVAVQLRDGVLYVLEMFPGGGKVKKYTPDGTFLGQISLARYGVVPRFSVAPNGFVIERGDFGGLRRELVLIDSAGEHTIHLFDWNLPERLTVAPAGGVRFTTAPPFAASLLWTGGPDGQIALWHAGDSAITMLRERRTARRLSVPRLPPVSVEPDDRRSWLNEQFPSVFMGFSNDPLALTRAEAERSVTFPQSFPAVLGLLSTREDGVWIRRTPQSAGEEWLRLSPDGECGKVRLPARQQLLSVGTRQIVVLRLTDLDEELIDVYSTGDVNNHLIPCMER